MTAARAWSAEEVETMRRDYVALGAEALAKALGRTVVAVNSKAGLLELTDAAQWSEAELAILRADFKRLGCVKLAAVLGRSPGAVRRMTYRFAVEGVGRGKRPGCTALTDRIAAMVAAAGAAGLSARFIRETMNTANKRTCLTVLSRLARDAIIFGAGFQGDRHYFSTAAWASTWNATANPLTLKRRDRDARREKRIQDKTAALAATKAKRALLAATPGALRYRLWTPEEDALIRSKYPTGGSQALTALTARSKKAISVRAANLGVKCTVAPVSLRLQTKPAPKASEKGPFLADAPLQFHPQFKFTRAEARPPALRTNTFSHF